MVSKILKFAVIIILFTTGTVLAGSKDYLYFNLTYDLSADVFSLSSAQQFSEDASMANIALKGLYKAVVLDEDGKNILSENYFDIDADMKEGVPVEYLMGGEDGTGSAGEYATSNIIELEIPLMITEGMTVEGGIFRIMDGEGNKVYLEKKLSDINIIVRSASDKPFTQRDWEPEGVVMELQSSGAESANFKYVISGGLGAVIIIGVIIYYFIRRRKKADPNIPQDPASSSNSPLPPNDGL